MAADWPQLPAIGLLQHRSLADSYGALMNASIWPRAQFATVIMLLAAVYCWGVASAARPGLPRLLLCLPVLVVMHATPFLFDHILEPFATITATFLACRMTCGKVVAFIMGRGVLVLPLSLPQFAAVMLAPFMPAQLVGSALSMYSAPAEHDKNAQNKTADTSQSMPDSCANGGSVWQQVTPTQRYSIDSTRHSTDSRRSSDGRWSMESSTNHKTADASTAGQHHAVHSVVAISGSRTDSGPAAPSTEPDRFSCRNNSKPQRVLTPLTVANYLLNAAVVGAFIWYTCHSKQRMISTSVSIAGLWVMWRAMECVMRAASTPARTFLGMTLAPHFRNPFASSSLTDFWARRWNITQGLVLRFCVYEPIVEARWVPETATPGKAAAAAAQAKAERANSGDSSVHDSNNSTGLTNRKGIALNSNPKRQHVDLASAGKSNVMPHNLPVLSGPSRTFAPRWRRQLAAAATFVVSGLEHEVFMAYITHTWGWKWFVFFSLQGLFLALEGPIKRSCSKIGLRLHPRVAILAVLLALGVVGDVFFWPVLVQPRLVGPLEAALPEQLKELVAKLQPVTATVM